MEDFLGTNDYAAFKNLFIWAMIGITISLLLHGANRNPTTPTTPYKFKLWVLVVDNWKRIVVDALILFCSIRFYPEIFGKPINQFLALGLGIGFDQLVKIWKAKSSFLQVNREKLFDPAETKPPLNNNK